MKTYKIGILLLAAALGFSAEGYISIDYKRGRARNGRQLPSLTLRWDDPSTVPEIKSETYDDGRMDVVVTNGATHLIFYQTGEAEPIREYVLTPGPKKFSELELVDGQRYSETTWTYQDDGLQVMECFDAAGKLLKRDSVRREYLASGEERKWMTVGGVITETHYIRLPGYGKWKRYEKVGTGPTARWTFRAPVRGSCKGAVGLVQSEIDSDGEWYWTKWQTNGVVRKAMVTTSLPGSVCRTNSLGEIVGFIGKAHRTEYLYEPLDPLDTLEHSERTPRTTIKYEISDDGARRELSREYFVEIRSLTNQTRTVICESAGPDRPYGDARNRRETTVYHFRNNHAGRILRQERSDGSLRVYAYELIGDRKAFVREWFDTDREHPEGVPYKTVMTRELQNFKGDVLREEKWLFLPDGDKELLSWTDYERTRSGRMTKSKSSEGKTEERRYFRNDLVYSRDSSGRETNYAYDPYRRMTRVNDRDLQARMSYDLGSLMTNVTGRIFGHEFRRDQSFDDAGQWSSRTDETGGRLVRRSEVADNGDQLEITVRDLGTPWCVTNVTITSKDGSRQLLRNGRIVSVVMPIPEGEITFYGPLGTNSPRWVQSRWGDGFGGTETTTPGVGGGFVVRTNDLWRMTGADGAKKDEARYVKYAGRWWYGVPGGRRRLVGRRETDVEESVEEDASGSFVLRRVRENASVQERICELIRGGVDNVSRSVSTNGLLMVSESATGVRECCEYDDARRLIASRDGRGRVSRFAYDELGRLVSVVREDGRSTTYRYDRRGCVREVVFPSGCVLETVRDLEGRVVKRTFGGETEVSEYDEFGDLVRVRIQKGSELVRDVLFQWDAGTGLVTNLVENGVACPLAYSPENELVRVGETVLADYRLALTNGISWVKDAHGRTVAQQVEDKERVRWSFDPKTGRLDAFEIPGLGSARVTYFPASDLVSSIVYPNGVEARFDYSREDQLVSVAYAGLADGQSRDYACEPKDFSWPDPVAPYRYAGKPIAEDPDIHLPASVFLSLGPVARQIDGEVFWCVNDTQGQCVGLMNKDGAWRSL